MSSKNKVEPRLAIFIVHPHELSRIGIESLLVQSGPNARDVRSVRSMREVDPVTLRSFEPQILVVSSDIEPEDLTLISELFATPMKVLVLVRSSDPSHLLRAAMLPAQGFVLEEGITLGGLNAGILGVTEGYVLMPSIMADVVSEGSNSEDGLSIANPELRFPGLTPREQDVLEQLALGNTNKEIASKLRISHHCAKRHVASVLVKLGVKNRTLAASWALREGMASQVLASQSPSYQVG